PEPMAVALDPEGFGRQPAERLLRVVIDQGPEVHTFRQGAPHGLRRDLLPEGPQELAQAIVDDGIAPNDGGHAPRLHPELSGLHDANFDGVRHRWSPPGAARGGPPPAPAPRPGSGWPGHPPSGRPRH